jgi:UDP-N-acetylmuramoylalanine--D-glutamate ligase
MPTLPSMTGTTVAVMGLGKSGTSAARALAAAGATVWAWDDNAATRAAARAAGVPLVDLSAADLAQARMVMWSPGIAHTHPKPHPVAQRARAAGVPLLCDVELLVLACPEARFVGITGTNGKSTTTALTAHLLAAAGCKVAAGGNLGIPALDLPALGDGGVYVLELSSYQLELLERAAFDAGILLNITPDHLGRHGGMDGYIAAKASLFDRLRPNGAAVIGIDDEPSRSIFDRLRGTIGARAVPISSEQERTDGVSAPAGILIDPQGAKGRIEIDLRHIPTLPGRHNWQNACAAYAAGRALGLSPAAMRDALATYPGLAHRQELVATIDGIRYVNDSKATNADAAARALVCYDDIYWIIGGQAKEGGIASLAHLFPRVRRAFLIGEASDAFAATIEGKIPYDRCGTLDVAVDRARRSALAEKRPHPVVLLSPACASWDQFKNFEHRGDVFRQLVQSLETAGAAR